MTHICVGKLTTVASDNGLSPERRQAIIWINAGILLIGPLGTKFNEILIEIDLFSFMKMHLKMSSAKCRPFCLGPNVLRRRDTRVTSFEWFASPSSNLRIYRGTVLARYSKIIFFESTHNRYPKSYPWWRGISISSNSGSMFYIYICWANCDIAL